MIARMRLRRGDGRVYLERWGIESKRVGGIFVHKMSAPDPGVDVHDHPWSFWSLILKGGYVERRANTRKPGVQPHRGRGLGSLRLMRLDEAHTITHLKGETSWSLVVHGPTVRCWGFYVWSRRNARWDWVESAEYADSERGLSRDLATEVHS